jgi:single-strand DNA-binding protein
MSEVNKVIISGRIGKEPEIRDLDGGKRYAIFPLAMNRSFRRNGSEEWEQETMWFNITVYSPTIINRIEEGNLGKGYRVLIVGQIRQNTRTDSQTQKNITYWNVICNSINTLSRPMEKNSNPRVTAAAEDTDIPF